MRAGHNDGRQAFPTDGGPPVTICSSCYIKWPHDQNAVFLSFAETATKEAPQAKITPRTKVRHCRIFRQVAFDQRTS